MQNGIPVIPKRLYSLLCCALQIDLTLVTAIWKKGTRAMAAVKFVSYLRVSTDKQGRSGLGLEAQREAVLRYLNGGQWKLVAEYVEVESGKRNSRPQLQAAISHAKATGAKVLRPGCMMGYPQIFRMLRTTCISEITRHPLTGHAADMPKSTRMTHLRHQPFPLLSR
jgi:hypothetical protein